MPRRRDPWNAGSSPWGSAGSEDQPGRLSYVISGIQEFVRGGILRYGKRTADSTVRGFWLGVDDDRLAKFHLGNATYYLYWTGTELRIKADKLTIDAYGIKMEAGTNANQRYQFEHNGSIIASLTLDPNAGEDEAQLSLSATGHSADDLPNASAEVTATSHDLTKSASVKVIAITSEAWVEIYPNQHLTGYMQLDEISTPAAPDSNKARLFAKDNGSGKTQICVRFPTGAVQVLATEP